MLKNPEPIPLKELKVLSKPLSLPNAKQVVNVLEKSLGENFQTAHVRWVECPDLTKEPFHLAAPGLCGSPKIVDIGGVYNLLPLPTKAKVYDMTMLPKVTNMADKDVFIIGAGAGDWRYKNQNSEFMPNMVIGSNGVVNQQGHVAYTTEGGGFKQEKLPQTEKTMSILGNLFLSEGKPGQVLEVSCKKRTGKQNLIGCMRQSLVDAFPGQAIAMGGTFVISSGKAKIHVMPDFSETPLDSDAKVDEWLKFFEASSPFISTSVLVTNDMNLGLRLEHTHGFSLHGDGGHYHYDITPVDVEYLGYFNIAEDCFKIDPKE